MYWQISVTIMSFGDHGGSERNGSQNLCGSLWLTTICALASRWQSEMVPSRVYYVTENVENFQSKCYHFTATKTPETVSVKQYEHDRVTRCTFSVDFKEIKTISQSLPSPYVICLQTAVTEERLERIGYLEPWIFEYESRDIFSEDVWHTRQALMKWHIKVPKANSRWYVEYVQLVKTDVEFHCSRTLR